MNSFKLRKCEDFKTHFLFYCQNPDKSSNVPLSIVCSAIGAESLWLARASNNPESFSTATKLLIFPYEQVEVSPLKK